MVNKRTLLAMRSRRELEAPGDTAIGAEGHRACRLIRSALSSSFFFSFSANIQQWASPFTAGVSWLSRPDQLTRL